MDTVYTNSEGKVSIKRINGTYQYNISKSGYVYLSDNTIVFNADKTVENNLIPIWILDDGIWDNTGVWSNNSNWNSI